jgi:hypothetical protein
MKPCLRTLLAIGIAMIFFMAPISCTIPYANIDAVLSPEELADNEKLSIAQRFAEASNEWRLWVFVGVIITAVSSAGLFAARKDLPN